MASSLETTADLSRKAEISLEKPWCLSYPGGPAAPPHYLQLIATMYIVVPTRLWLAVPVLMYCHRAMPTRQWAVWVECWSLIKWQSRPGCWSTVAQQPPHFGQAYTIMSKRMDVRTIGINRAVTHPPPRRLKLQSLTFQNIHCQMTRSVNCCRLAFVCLDF